MEKDILRGWSRAVAKQIRFAPDRKEVEQELYDHLLEHRDLLMEEGLSQQEAEEQAAAAMGDPVALGRQLDRIHDPLLGWLWKLSHILLYFMLGLTISVLISFLDGGPVDDFAFWLESQRDPYLFSDSFADEGEERRIHMPSDGTLMATVMPQSVTYGDYTVSLLEGQLMGWLIEDDLEPGASPYLHQELTIFLRVECDKPWMRFPEGLHYLEGVDEQGNRYFTTEDYIHVPDQLGRDGSLGRVHAWASSYVESTMPDWTKALSVFGYMPNGETWHPEWIELYLPESVGEFRMRLSLNYREVAQ